jgi:hypothetical protein
MKDKGADIFMRSYVEDVGHPFGVAVSADRQLKYEHNSYVAQDT